MNKIDFDFDIDKIIYAPGREPLKLDTIRILLGNAGIVEGFKIKDLKVQNYSHKIPWGVAK